MAGVLLPPAAPGGATARRPSPLLSTAPVPTALLLLAACTAPTVSPPDADAWDFPALAELPEQVEPPDPFVTFFGGASVDSTRDWEILRRPELLALFDHYQYGVAATAPAVEVVEGDAVAVLDGATLRELEIRYGAAPTLHVALFVPDGAPAPPVVVGLDKCGNQTVTDDPAVTPSTAWIEDTCDPARGSRAAYWSLDRLLGAGFAVAVAHQSDIAPDDRDDTEREGGVFPAFDAGDPPWATISAWAWGMSRIVDALEVVGGVDTTRIAAFGHSRRGKTALLAAARDARFTLVWAHQSGTAGAALSRHLEGESIGAITALFPHWFVPAFAEFYGWETLLPVDQHLLLALVAPRPLLVTDGEDDDWADPEGARQAVELATPVWDLYGAALPTWTLRDGEHEVRDDDWERFVAFADAAW